MAVNKTTTENFPAPATGDNAPKDIAKTAAAVIHDMRTATKADNRKESRLIWLLMEASDRGDIPAAFSPKAYMDAMRSESGRTGTIVNYLVFSLFAHYGLFGACATSQDDKATQDKARILWSYDKGTIKATKNADQNTIDELQAVGTMMRRALPIAYALNSDELGDGLKRCYQNERVKVADSGKYMGFLQVPSAFFVDADDADRFPSLFVVNGKNNPASGFASMKQLRDSVDALLKVQRKTRATAGKTNGSTNDKPNLSSQAALLTAQINETQGAMDESQETSVVNMVNKLREVAPEAYAKATAPDAKGEGGELVIARFGNFLDNVPAADWSDEERLAMQDIHARLGKMLGAPVKASKPRKTA